jgi:hypothetical protein
VIKINESDKVDASLYSEASNEGGDGEGERLRGLRGGNLSKLVHWRGWGESQRDMVVIMAAEVVPRTWARVCMYSLSIYLALVESSLRRQTAFHSFYNVRD